MNRKSPLARLLMNDRPFRWLYPVAIATVVVFVFSVSYSALQRWASYFEISISPTTRVIFLGTFGTVIVFIFFKGFLNYLDTGTSIRRQVERASPDVTNVQIDSMSRKVSEELESVKKSLDNIGTVKFDIKEIDKAHLLETLRLSITQKLDEGVFKTIDEEFAKRDLKNKQWETLITDFTVIRKRLYDETNNLSRRANVNLAFGTLTTILAGLGLVAIVFWRPLDLAGLTANEYGWKVIAHYVPRLSLIVFAEVFAYFFLRLYKASLSDIKYYQNEISNVELKLVALKAALNIQDKEITKLVISELSKTERNFVLKKGETTLELERAKVDDTTVVSKDLLEQLTAVIKSK